MYSLFFIKEPPTTQFTPKIELATLYTFDLQSIPFKNTVDVASNGERFTLANAANLKTYIPIQAKLTKKSQKGTYGSGTLITKL
jgi:hypothetical protein